MDPKLLDTAVLIMAETLIARAYHFMTGDINRELLRVELVARARLVMKENGCLAPGPLFGRPEHLVEYDKSWNKMAR